MVKTYSTAKKKETAVLVAVAGQDTNEVVIEEHLDELEFLVKTSGAETKYKFKQKLRIAPETECSSARTSRAVLVNAPDLIA